MSAVLVGLGLLILIGLFLLCGAFIRAAERL